MDFWISGFPKWISGFPKWISGFLKCGRFQIYKLISPFRLEFRIPSLFVKRFMGFLASVFWHSGCLDFSIKKGRVWVCLRLGLVDSFLYFRYGQLEDDILFSYLHSVLNKFGQVIMLVLSDDEKLYA